MTAGSTIPLPHPSPRTSCEAPGATPSWVGQVDARGPVESIRVAPGFVAARLLVTVDGVPAGEIRVPLDGGVAPGAAVGAAIREQLGTALADVAAPPAPVTRPITVVVATRNRPESLRRCLHSLLRSDHPRLSVLVVDNDPDDDRTADVVRAQADARVTYVRESRRGTSNGRNRGLQEAVRRHGPARAGVPGALVAFTDDDVEVDPGWAGRVAAALSVPGVSCVTGPVLAARLDTAAQAVAEEALGWRKGFARRRFSLAEPPRESAVFPFSPGLFGVGANLAVDATAALELGGFDPALGPGTATRGGEDCEFLIRMVLAGHTLTYEPSAYLWHHHRPTTGELAEQMDGYALGLGGFLAKIVLDPVGRADALRRIPAAVAQLRRIRSREATAAVPGSAGKRRLGTLVLGPVAYVRARRAVRRTGGSTPALRAAPRG